MFVCACNFARRILLKIIIEIDLSGRDAKTARKRIERGRERESGSGNISL